MHRDERVTDEMISVALIAFQSGDMDWSSQDEELMRFALEEAIDAMPKQKPVSHLVWRQYLRAADDVEDYYEVARPGDKCVDGSEPFPVYAHPPHSALVNAQADADVVESLDARMKAAGMYTIDEMMGVTPLTKWMSNPAINTIEAFSEWLDRKVSEYIRMKAAYDLGDKDESDELYEWVQAHSAVFSTIRDQFQVVRSSGSAEVDSKTTSKGQADE